MKIITNKTELQNAITTLKKQGKTIGFAPTMGALHAGHMSLYDIAKQNADIIVASIFVNPAQFAPNEDFDSYPRREQEDLDKLEKQGVDIAYLPKKEDLYPECFDLKISVGKIGQILEGVTRPHFFDGVALVVTKLFMQVTPDVAVFGEKDFQQLHVIKQVAKWLDMPIKIIGAPIVREASGLAMSSRNLYLCHEQRKIASSLYKTMCDIKNKKITIEQAKKDLIKSGFDKVDYLELRDANTLYEQTSSTQESRLLAAVYIGSIRLIDNIEV